MTRQPLSGIRVLEVAQFVFVPAGGAVLADWGADVIKVEHAVRGDAQRGNTTGAGRGQVPPGFNAGMEHANRGKRSIGLDISTAEGREVLLQLAADADVFLTNYLPGVRRRLGIDVEDIRAVNPDIVYARGSNTGVRGPDADRGGFDLGTFWARSGGSRGVTPPELTEALFQPGPAYGDTISGTILAGGIAAALLARERTGEGSVVDVSLLSAGAWALGMAVDHSLASGEPWTAMPSGKFTAPSNPLVGAYRTADARHVQLMMVQPAPYAHDFLRHLGRPDLVDDPRFATAHTIMAHTDELAVLLAAEFRAHPLQLWVERLGSMAGQWAIVQDTLQLGHDPELRANGHLATVRAVDGTSFELVSSPVQFDETPLSLTRSPTFAENTDEVLLATGIDQARLIELKVRGAVT